MAGDPRTMDVDDLIDEAYDAARLTARLTTPGGMASMLERDKLKLVLKSLVAALDERYARAPEAGYRAVVERDDGG